MHPDWARYTRGLCGNFGIPFWFKQWGAWAPEDEITAVDLVRAMHRGMVYDWGAGNAFSYRVGKKTAGRLLDGQIHDGGLAHEREERRLTRVSTQMYKRL